MRRYLIVPLFLIAIISIFPILRGKAAINRLAFQTLFALRGPAGSHITVSSLPEESLKFCRVYWMQGLLQGSRGKLTARNVNFMDAIKCDNSLVIFLHSLYPEDQELAQLALNNAPDSAEAMFWMAELLATKDPVMARQLLAKGLEIEPSDGLRWRIYGDLLWNRDPYAAIQAFLQSCYNGDPGSNGCYRAGLVAEGLGDYQAAIEYYRLSKNSASLERANHLEAQLMIQTTP